MKGKKIPDWQLNSNSVADIPVTTREGIYQGITGKEEVILKMISYGCTKLRVVGFSVVQ